MPMKNPPHPGEVVRDAIENGLGLTVTAAAEGLGVSRKTLSQILNGRASISTEMAIRLEDNAAFSQCEPPPPRRPRRAAPAAPPPAPPPCPIRPDSPFLAAAALLALLCSAVRLLPRCS